MGDTILSEHGKIVGNAVHSVPINSTVQVDALVIMPNHLHLILRIEHSDVDIDKRNDVDIDKRNDVDIDKRNDVDIVPYSNNIVQNSLLKNGWRFLRKH